MPAGTLAVMSRSDHEALSADRSLARKIVMVGAVVDSGREDGRRARSAARLTDRVDDLNECSAQKNGLPETNVCGAPRPAPLSEL